MGRAAVTGVEHTEEETRLVIGESEIGNWFARHC